MSYYNFWEAWSHDLLLVIFTYSICHFVLYDTNTEFNSSAFSLYWKLRTFWTCLHLSEWDGHYYKFYSIWINVVWTPDLILKYRSGNFYSNSDLRLKTHSKIIQNASRRFWMNHSKASWDTLNEYWIHLEMLSRRLEWKIKVSKES